MSLPEVLLWQQLRETTGRDCKFRKQFPIGEMTVDFACLEQRLIIEVDGEGARASATSRGAMLLAMRCLRVRAFASFALPRATCSRTWTRCFASSSALVRERAPPPRAARRWSPSPFRGRICVIPPSSSPIAARSPAGSSAPRGGWAIRTVAVYSDADAKALHVREADEAVHIGPAPGARELSRAARRSSPRRRQTGAEAIHPGYGFLSRERRLRRGGDRRRA